MFLFWWGRCVCKPSFLPAMDVYRYLARGLKREERREKRGECMQHVCDPDWIGWREAPEKEFNIPGEITEPLCALCAPRVRTTEK